MTEELRCSQQTSLSQIPVQNGMPLFEWIRESRNLTSRSFNGQRGQRENGRVMSNDHPGLVAQQHHSPALAANSSILSAYAVSTLQSRRASTRRHRVFSCTERVRLYEPVIRGTRQRLMGLANSMAVHLHPPRSLDNRIFRQLIAFPRQFVGLASDTSAALRLPYESNSCSQYLFIASLG